VLKIGQEVVDMLGSTADGDEAGFERAKMRWGQMGLPPEAVAGFTVADLPMLRQKAGTQLRELQLKNAALAPQLTQAQIDAQRANIRQSDAAADASNRANRTPAGIDPYTGKPKVPDNIRAKDYVALDKMSLSADAAASAAASLRAVKPALDQGMTGPNFRAQRTAAGALSYIPGLSGAARYLTGEDKIAANINTFDQIEGAALDAAIKKLEEVGGSDTNQELMTAMKTTISPDLLPEENMRRYRSKLAAAEIVAKKAQLASEWRNNIGSLDGAAPDGTTWQEFWPAYQKQAWAKHRQQEAAIVAEEKRKAKEGKEGSSGGLGGWTINLVTQ
jgi:hypothetical protein